MSVEKRLYTHEDKDIALVRQEYMCGGCGYDLWREPYGYTQGHHILPYGMGGATNIDNLVVLCPNCHVLHDNMAVCGTVYGGYDITEIQEEQIRDQEKYNGSIDMSRINANNPKIRKTIIKFRHKIWKENQQMK